MSERYKYTPGFLYSIKTGVVTIREGNMAEYNYRQEPADNAVFVFGDILDGYTPHVECSRTPGVVHKMCLWLPNKNTSFAMSELIMKELEEIQKLEDNINKRKTRIEYLRNFGDAI